MGRVVSENETEKFHPNYSVWIRQVQLLLIANLACLSTNIVFFASTKPSKDTGDKLANMYAKPINEAITNLKM